MMCDRRRRAGAAERTSPAARITAICHPDPTTGAYAQTWSTSRSSRALEDGALDVDGNPVSMATQEANRAYNVARVEAVGRDRVSIIASLDATIPDIQVAVKDLSERGQRRKAIRN